MGFKQYDVNNFNEEGAELPGKPFALFFHEGRDWVWCDLSKGVHWLRRYTAVGEATEVAGEPFAAADDGQHRCFTRSKAREGETWLVYPRGVLDQSMKDAEPFFMQAAPVAGRWVFYLRARKVAG